MGIIALEEKRDEQLKRRYLKKIQGLGIKNPAVLSQVSDYLSPEIIARCREDMKAVVYGEPESKESREPV